MSTRRYVNVRLELEVNADPVAGRVQHGGGEPRPFGGWLELAAALRDALDSSPSGARTTTNGLARSLTPPQEEP